MKRVLIIDDSEFMRIMLDDLFRSEGFEVAGAAKSGEEGIKAFQDFRPDLVTLDMIMPGEGGLTALRDILKIDKDAKVLVISSKTQKKKFGEDALAIGAKGLLLKPFRPSDFRSTVKNMFV